MDILNFTYNTWILLGLFAVSLAAFKLSKIKFREVRFMMIFMLVFLVLNNLFIFLFDPNQGTTLYGTRHMLCHLFWRYDLTAEQLFYMLNISLKYFVALPVAILFISATNPSEFAASLNSIGISYKVGYSVAIALRYIPDIQRDYHSISQAQQARGVELGINEHFFARLKNSVNILLPLILTSLNRIDTISNALIQQHDFVLCTSQGNRIHSRHIIKLPFHHSASAATKSLTWNLLSIRQQMNLFNVSHCHPESFQMRRHSKLLTLALQKLCNLQFLLRSACMNEVC